MDVGNCSKFSVNGIMGIKLRKYIELRENCATENYSRPWVKSDIYNCLVALCNS